MRTPDDPAPNDSGPAFPSPVSGFVLAGGRSFRLGQDKVLLPWNGQPLIAHAVQRLQCICATISICANRDDLDRFLPGPEGRVLRDFTPDAGPLAGIVAALQHSSTDWNLFLAVDLPFIPVEFLQSLLRRTLEQPVTGPALCMVPRFLGMPQPLCALYRRALLPGLVAALQSGQYKIMRAVQDAVASLPTGHMEIVQAETLLPGIDSQHFPDWFLNINTPHDWHSARQKCVP